MNDYPKTYQEWWEWVDSIWNNINYIVTRYTPVTDEELENMKEAKNQGALDKVMNDAWFNAPESLGTREIPGFMKMCDILSQTPLCREKINV